ncbi:hypothetical protein EalM132_00112 [Exiguobacterium phage vB_EalM-132]|nr:hypothetical protein EalM132_00112 [Exiguobacterium phage vB_EalM-132]
MAKQAKVVYQVGNDVAVSLKAVAELLGVSRVSAKDVEEDGKYADQVMILTTEEVETLEDADSETAPKETVEDTVNNPTDEDTSDEEVEKEATGDSEDESVSDEDWEDPNPVRLKKEEENEDEEHPMEREEEEEPYSALEEDVEIDEEAVRESMPEEFESLDELKEFIKDMDTATLEYMAVGLKLSWKPTEHKNIHRMRIAMAFHNHYFPKKETANKANATSKGGKYKDYSTEDLEKLLKDNDVEYKTYEDENIHRMRLVMAAKKHNLLS